MHSWTDSSNLAVVCKYAKILRTLFADLARPVRILPVKEAYELWAPTYDLRDKNVVLEAEERASLPIFDRIELADKCVVDFGCGTGRHIRHCLARKVRTIVGVDISESMLQEAGRVNKDPRVLFVQTGLDRIPLPDDKFDFGIASLVLSHVRRLEPPLREMARVLRRGAKLVVTDLHWSFGERGWHRTFRPQSEPRQRIAPQSYYHLMTEYQAAFENNNLVIEEFSEPGLDSSLRPFFERASMMREFEKYQGQPLLVVFEVRRR